MKNFKGLKNLKKTIKLNKRIFKNFNSISSNLKKLLKNSFNNNTIKK